MGGGKGGKHQTSFSRIPDSAHSADTKIEAVICFVPRSWEIFGKFQNFVNRFREFCMSG